MKKHYTSSFLGGRPFLLHTLAMVFEQFDGPALMGKTELDIDISQLYGKKREGHCFPSLLPHPKCPPSQ